MGRKRRESGREEERERKRKEGNRNSEKERRESDRANN